MQQEKHNTNKSIVFSKWTRKAYAIFASLHREVKIAQLSIDVCISSFQKLKSLIHSQRVSLNLNLEIDENETNQDGLLKLVYNQLHVLGLLPVEEYPAKYKKKNYYIYPSPLLVLTSNGLFYFTNYD